MEFTSGCPCQQNAVKICAAFFGFEISYKQSECCCAPPTLKDGAFEVKYMPAIMRYLGVKAHCTCYYDRDIQQKGAVDTWLDCAQALICKLTQHGCVCACAECYSDALAKSTFQKLEAHLQFISDHLENNTFLVNERISLADILMVSILHVVFSRYISERNPKYATLIRYAKTIAAYNGIESIIGAFEFTKGYKVHCEAENAPKKAEKAEKVEKAEKKKEKEENDEEDEPAPKPKPVAKYTYTTDLNAWKRYYKNLDWENHADWTEYFWNTAFKPEEFSLWLLVYKYPENFKEDWKTKNLITILIQRLRNEKAEQHTFANFLVVKSPDQDHFQVICVAMMPGKEVIPEWAECSGVKSFDFIKIEDHAEPETREFIKRVFNWDEENPMVYHGMNFGMCADGNGETFV